MNVLSIPQIFAYLIGWWQYDLFWQVLRDTGLFYIPFAVIFAKSVIAPFLSQETRSAATTALKRLGVNIISIVLVIPLVYAPSVYLNLKSIQYKQSGQQYVIGQTKTTFDQHIDPKLFGGGVSIPLGWVLTLSVANGITAIGFNSLEDQNMSARQMTQKLGYSVIKDPKLKAEVNQFIRSCYVPAYADYIHGNYTDAQKSAIHSMADKYGQADLGWIGSHVLRKFFYPRYQSSETIEGFAFDPNRDAIEGQVSSHSKWGKPMCNEWWEDYSYGLRQKLIKGLDKQSGGKTTMWFLSHYHFWNNSNDIQDAALQWYLQKSLKQSFMGVNQGYYSENDVRTGSGKAVGEALSKVGVVYDYNTSFSGYITTLINMLPVIQAMLLCILFATLPFGMVLSCFNLRFVVTSKTMACFLIFLTYIWHLVSFLDTFLITSLYQSSNPGYAGLNETMAEYFAGAVSPAQVLVDIAVSLMYIGFPMFMLGMIGWAGVNAGSEGFRATSTSAQSESMRSGSSGSSVLSKIGGAFK